MTELEHFEQFAEDFITELLTKGTKIHSLALAASKADGKRLHEGQAAIAIPHVATLYGLRPGRQGAMDAVYDDLEKLFHPGRRAGIRGNIDAKGDNETDARTLAMALVHDASMHRSKAK